MFLVWVYRMMSGMMVIDVLDMEKCWLLLFCKVCISYIWLKVWFKFLVISDVDVVLGCVVISVCERGFVRMLIWIIFICFW